MKYKSRGLLCYQVEQRKSIQERVIHYLDPMEMGMDEQIYGDALDYVNCYWETDQDRDNLYIPIGFPIRQYVTTVQTGKQSENGLVLTTRSWIGYRFRYGKTFCDLPPQVDLPEIIGAEHAGKIWENMENLADILPGLYQTFGPEVS